MKEGRKEGRGIGAKVGQILRQQVEVCRQAGREAGSESRANYEEEREASFGLEEEIGESAVHWLVGLVSLSLAFSASSFPSLASSLSLRLGSCILLTSRKISSASARPPAPQTIPYLIFRVGAVLRLSL